MATPQLPHLLCDLGKVSLNPEPQALSLEIQELGIVLGTLDATPYPPAPKTSYL